MTPKPAPNLTFNVTMKKRMIEHLDKMVIESGCSTRSEYLRGLIRDDARVRGVSLVPARKKKTTKKKTKR